LLAKSAENKCNFDSQHLFSADFASKLHFYLITQHKASEIV